MKRLKGFTLVELVIVIAIVIILSVVSVPIYRGYTRNAKMSEGYALLGMILSAQKAYFSQYGNFLAWKHASHALGSEYTSNEEVLGIDARGNKYFTFFDIALSSETEDIHYRFIAKVNSPKDIFEGAKTKLTLAYNITSGSTWLGGTSD